MGIDDRDADYRSRGPSPRRRPNDGDDPSARPSARSPRDMDSPRYRPPHRDVVGENDYDRPTRDPRGGSSRGGSGARYGGDDSSRRPRPGGPPPRGDRRSYDGSGYNEYDRPGRSSRSDPGASTARGDRSMRGARPSARDEGWGDPRAARSGARGGPAGSDGRMRRPAQAGGRGGGLWGDEPQSFGRLNARDARGRLLAPQEEEPASAAAGVGKALGSIVLALVLGAGAAYGYFVVSTPKLNVPASQQALPTAAPSSTPSVTPAASATTTGLISPPVSPNTLLIS